MVGSVTDGSSLISLFNGQTALSLLTSSADGSGDGATSVDFSSAILADMDAKAGIVDSSATGGASGAVAPTAPWNSATAIPAVSDAVRKAVDGGALIDPSAATLDAPAGSSAGDYKNLFALYQGLNALSDLAQTAAQQGAATSTSAAAALTSPYSMGQLEQAFSSGLQQLQTFLASVPFSGFSLTGGRVGTQQLSSVAIGDSVTGDSFTTGVLATGDQASAVAAFNGPIQFSINLTDKYIATPKTVNVDLSGMGDTPRTMDAVAAYINSQLRQAGAVTQFAVTKIGTTASQTVNGVTTPGQPQWGFTVTATPDEQVSFSAPSTAAAVYVTQSTGGAKKLGAGGAMVTTDTGEQLVKLDTQNDAVGSPPQGPFPTAQGATLPAGGVFAGKLPDGVSDIKASATGADGSVYLLADASGSVNGAPTPGGQGVALLKYDSAGQLTYSRMLSQGPQASAYSLAVDSDGKVAVGGTDVAASASGATKTQGFVQVFAADGQPAWSQTVPAMGGTVTTSGVAFGADGSVYLSGVTTGSVNGQIPHGSTDEFIQGFAADGTATFTRQFGSSGTNTSAGVAYDAATNSLYTAGLENGHAVVRNFALNGAAAPTDGAVRDLGAADGVVGIGVQNGQVAVAGNASAASLGNAGTVTQGFVGEGDAWVANLTTALTSAGSDTIAYLGTSGATQKATAMAFAGGDAYVTGTIANDPSSLAASGATEGFVTGVAAGTGQVNYSTKLAGADGQGAPMSIAVGTTGASALDLLGLPQGAINGAQSDLIVANTGIKAGDSFYLRTTPGGAQTQISITAKDTLATLVDKINGALHGQGTASVLAGKLQIASSGSGAFIELDSQSEIQNPFQSKSSTDVLGALGLTTGVIRTVRTVQNGLTDPTQLRAYGLSLPTTLAVDTPAKAQAAMSALSSAMYKVQQAYQDLVNPPTLQSEAAAKAQSASGAVPAYLTNEIANYQAGLNRLLGGG